MKHLNFVHLIGALSGQINTGHMRRGGEWCSFRIRTANPRGGNGMLHNIKCFHQNSIAAIKPSQQGALIEVKGRISRRKWEKQDGSEEWITEIVAEAMNMAGDSPEEMPESGYGTSPDDGLDDDEVPF